MTQTQHLKRVEAAAARLATAREKFDAAIRAAVAGGCSIRAIAEVSSLGKSRVAEIAKGQR